MKIIRNIGIYAESLREEVLKETEFALEDVANNLSHYAAEGDVADEFIAEAFAEYMDSATPRPIVQKVGEKLSSMLSKKIKRKVIKLTPAEYDAIMAEFSTTCGDS